MEYTEHKENFRVYKGLDLVRENPYGFWRIYKDGKAVQGLGDSYTQIGLALKAIDANYVEPVRKKKNA